MSDIFKMIAEIETSVDDFTLVEISFAYHKAGGDGWHEPRYGATVEYHDHKIISGSAPITYDFVVEYLRENEDEAITIARDYYGYAEDQQAESRYEY